ncbi:hypothetical protein [Breznakia pachnodae]|uniref:Uncharacterized protein n=1 Tax=Breznakia pachnodae TaxID=265178 RepID=A0ABU0DY14_9FIRM|nr:hypothetical protein [Breznakia pachnodae]MDQ0359445.1 hypothetical protein [Breznakia pachnodae]
MIKEAFKILLNYFVKKGYSYEEAIVKATIVEAHIMYEWKFLMVDYQLH